MKKCIAFLLVIYVMFVIVGCQDDIVGETRIYLPFNDDQIDYIEMFRYTDDVSFAEKKIVTEVESVSHLYGTFERLSVEPPQEQLKDNVTEVIAFRFYLSESTEEPYDIIYYGYGVKDGMLKLNSSEDYYVTNADISWNWCYLDRNLKAMPVDMNEILLQ